MNSFKEKIRAWALRFKEKHGYSPAWFARYAAGGTMTFVLELAVYFFLLWLEPQYRLCAIVVSNLASYVFNYFISKYWVFRSPETKHSRDVTLFAVSCAANLLVVLVSAKLILLGLELIPLSGELWDAAVALIAKIGSNVFAFITVLIFKRFVIWKDTSKY